MRARWLVALLCIVLPLGAGAEDARWQPGKHYVEITIPVAQADPSAVEVVEVFSYACPHCYEFDPQIEAWREGAEERGIHFVRSPAIFNPTYKMFAQAYYTAEALGVLGRVHSTLFEALHAQQRRLFTVDAMAGFFSEHEVARADFDKAFNSFGVRAAVQQADGRARAWGVTGVPAMIVAGRYRVDAQMTGSHEAMLEVVDWLAARERSKLGPAAGD